MKRKCSCGRIHTLIPASAKFIDDGSLLSGWYWNCICKSTLFQPKGKS